MTSRRHSCIVLGGGGFLGTNLCHRLAASGVKVRAFGRQRVSSEHIDGLDWYPGDYSDATALASAIEGYEIVFHLLHTTTPHTSNLDMVAEIQQNVISTLAVLDISRNLGVKRVVFVSSGGVIYGPSKQIPTPETAPTDPITAYGISKLTIEKYLALYEHLHGLNYRVLRVTNPFGPFQIPRKNQGIIATLISRALKHESIEIWGDGSVVRDYIFVSDVIDALEAAAVDQSDTRIFNIGSGHGRNLREIISVIETQLNNKIDIIWKEGRSIDVPISIVSIERARDILGWIPKTPFEIGVDHTVTWWKNSGRIFFRS